MPCTIKDIAEKAGVSKTTVSFAFNNPGRIAPETLRKIMQVAHEMGYSPNPVARILMLKRTDSIAVTLPVPIRDLDKNPELVALLNGIGKICERKSRSLSILVPCGRSAENYISTAIVDGIIALEPDEELIAALKKRNIPHCIIDRDVYTTEEPMSPFEKGKTAAELLFRRISAE